MNSSQKLVLKRMGVMNVTPNSFSDAGIVPLISEMKGFDIIDVGAESTAPMNTSITAPEEWERLKAYLPELLKLPRLSLDTYHPETIFKMHELFKGELFWNDVSGKFDEHVKKFLSLGENRHYIFCHNLAPSRDLSGRHMDYISADEREDFLQSLVQFLSLGKHPRVILDPCLGFSKSYEQNWYVLEHFSQLQKLVEHPRWLLGFSRKSFVRKKFHLTLQDRDVLDQKHEEILEQMKPGLSGEVWVRSHRLWAGVFT